MQFKYHSGPQGSQLKFKKRKFVVVFIESSKYVNELLTGDDIQYSLDPTTDFSSCYNGYSFLNEDTLTSMRKEHRFFLYFFLYELKVTYQRTRLRFDTNQKEQCCKELLSMSVEQCILNCKQKHILIQFSLLTKSILMSTIIHYVFCFINDKIVAIECNNLHLRFYEKCFLSRLHSY